MLSEHVSSEQTRITYDPESKRFNVNRNQSSLKPRNETFPHTAPYELSPRKTLFFSKSDDIHYCLTLSHIIEHNRRMATSLNM